MSDCHELIENYFKDSALARGQLQERLFDIFVRATGYAPSDLCLVEERIKEGTEMKTIFYFDWKHRHQLVHPPKDV